MENVRTSRLFDAIGELTSCPIGVKMVDVLAIAQTLSIESSFNHFSTGNEGVKQ